MTYPPYSTTVFTAASTIFTFYTTNMHFLREVSIIFDFMSLAMMLSERLDKTRASVMWAT